MIVYRYDYLSLALQIQIQILRVAPAFPHQTLSVTCCVLQKYDVDVHDNENKRRNTLN